MEISPIALELIVACLPFLLGIYCFFSGRKQWGLVFLFLGALCLRLLMISLDPYLHNWDERFHALVAKNMIEHPFVPMLRANPVLPYDYKLWCCNHIWVHKQPIFLWQMAASMKLFGVNEVAMRLPSAILGALATLLVYRCGWLWFKDKTIAYIAALLFALSHYQLEMTSGFMSLEHNDLVYGCYVLASIWAYMEYRNHREQPWRWLLLLGLFVGLAVLNKWLTGLLVFAGWGTMLLLNGEERTNRQNWMHMAFALLVAVVVFMPWQLYIAYRFPLETAWEQHFNYLHIIKALDGHTGDAWYHVRFMEFHYGVWLLPFLGLGTLIFLVKGWLKRPFTLEMLVMVLLIYLFFSQVKTKMPAFTFVVAPIIFMMVAFGVYQVAAWIAGWLGYRRGIMALLVSLPIILFGFRPWEIIAFRSPDNGERNDKMHNTAIYHRLGQELPAGCVLFNAKLYEEIEIMFHTHINAYNELPQVSVIDSLVEAGYCVAVFPNVDGSPLPPEITINDGVWVLDKQLK